MKKLIGLLFILLGIAGGMYVGGWLLFIKPIIAICIAFDTGTITALMVGITVIKCVVASAVGGFLVWMGFVMGITINFND